MTDNDGFDPQVASEMRAYADSARVEVDAPALARGIAVQFPRSRPLIPTLVPRRAFTWLALAALVAAIALAAAALGSRPPAPPRPLGLLAFERGSDIFLADTVSGRVASFVGAPGDFFLGNWSPNGRWLSVATDRDVFLLDPATMTVRPAPTPSVLAADVSSPTTPPPFGAPTASPAATPSGGPSGGAPYGYGPAGWLPKGESILLHEYGSGFVFAVDIATGETSNMQMDSLCHAVVSPDGRFVAGIDRSNSDVLGGGQRAVVLDLATGDRTEVADFFGLTCGYYFGQDGPTWSADSERLAIVTTDSIKVVRRDGSEPADIVALDHLAGLSIDERTSVKPLWSPDGQWIAFIGPSGIEVVRPDGSQRHVVVADVFDAGQLAWTPDSTHLDYGIAAGEGHPGVAMWSADVATGKTALISLVGPYVEGFARQPVTDSTPRFILP